MNTREIEMDFEVTGRRLTVAVVLAALVGAGLDIYLLLETALHWRITGTVSGLAALLVGLAALRIGAKR